jgi:hypothetical protein
MIDNLGICKGPGTVLSQIKVGSDSVQLSRNGKHFYILLNNRVILAAKSDKDMFSSGIPIFASVLKSLSKKAGIDQLRWLPTTDTKKDNRMLSDVLKGISENLKPAEVFILTQVPDEIQDQKPKEASKTDPVKRIEDYRISLKVFGATIDGIKESSDVLLRTCLAKKMWGSKEIMGIIGDVRANMDELSGDFEQLDVCTEHSDNRARFIQAAFSRRIASDQVKETVGKVIEDFSYLKSFMSRLAQVLNPIYTIDKDFRERVGYPATWFFTPSTFMNFTYEYDNLIDHVIKAASLESKIIEPLMIWKMAMSHPSRS